MESKVQTNILLPFYHHKTIISVVRKRDHVYIQFNRINVSDAREISINREAFNNFQLPVDLEDLFELDGKYYNVIEFDTPLPKEYRPNEIIRIDDIPGDWLSMKPAGSHSVNTTQMRKQLLEPKLSLFINTKGLIRIWISNSNIPKNAGINEFEFFYTIKETESTLIAKMQAQITDLQNRLVQLEKLLM